MKLISSENVRNFTCKCGYKPILSSDGNLVCYDCGIAYGTYRLDNGLIEVKPRFTFIND